MSFENNIITNSLYYIKLYIIELHLIIGFLYKLIMRLTNDSIMRLSN